MQKQYTGFQCSDLTAENEIIPSNQSNSNNNYTNPKQKIKISQVARPRFELGSKAPKASMLGHYTRH